MVTTKEASEEFVEWNSFIRAGTPGANMEDARPVRKLTALTSMMCVHRSLGDQFMGFSGSSGPSQSTMLALSVSSGGIERVYIFWAASISAVPWPSRPHFSAEDGSMC